MAGESAEQRSRRLRSVARAVTSRRPASPGGPRAGAPDARGPGAPDERGAAAPPRLRCRGATRRRTADGAEAAPARPAADRVRAGARTCRRRSPRRSSIPGRIEVRGADRIAELEPLAAAPDGRRGVARPRRSRGPRRGTPLALAVAGADGAVVAAEGPEAADALRRLLERARHAARRARGEAAARRALRRATRGRDRRRSRSTPRSRPTSSTPRCAARRSPTSSPSTSTRSCRRRPSCRRPRAAGLEALSAIAVREPLETAARRGRPGAAVPRGRAAADPGAGADGGDRRRARPRRAGGARSRVRRGDRRGSSRRSTPTSGTSSTSAAPSSSSRSCSSS